MTNDTISPLDEAINEIEYRVDQKYNTISVRQAKIILDAYKEKVMELKTFRSSEASRIELNAALERGRAEEVQAFARIWDEMMQYIKDAPEEKIREWMKITGAKPKQ